MKKLITILLTFLFLSCSPPEPNHPSPPKFKAASMFDSCQFKGVQSVPGSVSVAYFTNCGDGTATIFGIIIYDPQNIELAGIEAAKIIQKQLGYEPVLTIVAKFMISDKYGVIYPFMIAQLVGRVNKLKGAF